MVNGWKSWHHTRSGFYVFAQFKLPGNKEPDAISQNDVVIIWWGQLECKWLQQNWNVDADGKIEIDMSRLMSVTLHCISKSPSSSVSDWRIERLWRCFSDCGVIKRYRKIGRPSYYSGKGISGTTNSLSPCATRVFVFFFRRTLLMIPQQKIFLCCTISDEQCRQSLWSINMDSFI